MNPQSRNENDEIGSLPIGLGLSIIIVACFFLFIASLPCRSLSCSAL